MDTLILIGVAVLVILVFIGAMVLGVYMRGKPIKHCGGSEITYKGEKIECPACESTECPTQAEAAKEA